MAGSASATLTVAVSVIAMMAIRERVFLMIRGVKKEEAYCLYFNLVAQVFATPKIGSLLNPKFLNLELVRLLEENKMKPAVLAKKLGIRSTTIYALKNHRRTLGEELFIKILRKGFGYSEKEITKIFLAAMKKKYGLK